MKMSRHALAVLLRRCADRIQPMDPVEAELRYRLARIAAARGGQTSCCQHNAWAHGTQTGYPHDGEPCHAAVFNDGLLTDLECDCPGWRAV
jgi:hypothetical protein